MTKGVSDNIAFGPRMAADVENRLRLNGTSHLQYELIGVQPDRLLPGADPDLVDAAGRVAQTSTTSEMRLAPHEKAIIQWVRGQQARAANPYEASNVSVLMVGEAGNVGVVNHQLDHIDGGLTSVMDGVEIASGEYDPAGMQSGEEYCKGWSICVNKLRNDCMTEAELVKAPEIGMVLQAHEAGTLAAAQHWFANFPGKEVTLVGAYQFARKKTSDPADAAPFFAEFGEFSDEQEDEKDELTFAMDDAMPHLLKAAKGEGVDASTFFKSLIAKAQL